VRKQEQQNCSAFDDRIRYIGNYSNHECTIELSNVSLEDDGEWRCEVVSYCLGPLPGKKDEKTITLNVKPLVTTENIQHTVTKYVKTQNAEIGQNYFKFVPKGLIGGPSTLITFPVFIENIRNNQRKMDGQ